MFLKVLNGVALTQDQFDLLGCSLTFALVLPSGAVTSILNHAPVLEISRRPRS